MWVGEVSILARKEVIYSHLAVAHCFTDPETTWDPISRSDPGELVTEMRYELLLVGTLTIISFATHSWKSLNWCV